MEIIIYGKFQQFIPLKTTEAFSFQLTSFKTQLHHNFIKIGNSKLSSQASEDLKNAFMRR